MYGRSTRGTRAAAGVAGLVALGIAACEVRPPVAVEVPQVEGLRRAVREPRQERSAAYLRCLDVALAEPGGDRDELIACMRAAGFGFLARSAEHREAVCREALATPDELPPSYCFQKLD